MAAILLFDHCLASLAAGTVVFAGSFLWEVSGFGSRISDLVTGSDCDNASTLLVSTADMLLHCDCS